MEIVTGFLSTGGLPLQSADWCGNPPVLPPVIPSGAKRSRGIYAFRYALRLTWCEDPSTPLRFAQDDRLFFCLRLRLKSSFSQCLLKPITLIGVCRDATVGAAISRPLLFRQRKCFRLSKTLRNLSVFGRLIAAPTVAMQRVWKSTNTNLSVCLGLGCNSLPKER